MFKGKKSTIEHDLPTYVFFLEHSLSWMGLHEARASKKSEKEAGAGSRLVNIINNANSDSFSEQKLRL